MRIIALLLKISFFTLVASVFAQVSDKAHPGKKKFSLTPVADAVASEDFPKWFLSNGLHHTNGLVAWFPFNGYASDESGYGNFITVNGAILTKDRHGRVDRAYRFDGQDDFMQVEYSKNINPSNFTLCVWVKPRIRKGYQTIVRNTLHGKGKGFLIYCGSGIWNFWTGSPAWTRIDRPKAINGKWTHLSFSFGSKNGSSRGVSTSYINGRKEHSKSASYVPNPSQVIYIGGVGSAYFFSGALDNIRIYNYALNESEIASLYALEK